MANEYRQFSYTPKSQIFHSKSTTYLLISSFSRCIRIKKHLSPRYFQIQHWKCRIGWSLVTGQPFAVCFSNILGEYIFTGAVATSKGVAVTRIFSNSEMDISDRGWDCSIQKLFLESLKLSCYQEGKIRMKFPFHFSKSNHNL